MVDSFSGVRLKLARAQDQIEGLQSDTLAFVDTHPYTAGLHFDRDARELTFSVQVKELPPTMWGVRIGEIIHNLRSALDHIVWELVVLKTGAPPRTKQNQFPVFDTESGFNDRGVGKFLVHVGTDAIDLIRSEQPFSTGEKALSPLWHLKELSDVDKHRTLHVTGSMVQAFSAKLPPLLYPVSIAALDVRPPGPIQNDAVLWRGSIPEAHDWPFQHRNVNANLTVGIAFDQRTPAVGGWLVIATLADIHGRTDRIARRIAAEMFKITL